MNRDLLLLAAVGGVVGFLIWNQRQKTKQSAAWMEPIIHPKPPPGVVPGTPEYAAWAAKSN